MRALSIMQPWAWLIVHGHKPVENRKWATGHRGPFLIHAGKKFDQGGYELVRDCYPDIQMPAPEDFPMGGVVGMASITDCVTAMNSSWFYGPFGFLLEDVRSLPLVPFRGSLGWFDVPDQLFATPNATRLTEETEIF